MLMKPALLELKSELTALKTEQATAKVATAIGLDQAAVIAATTAAAAAATSLELLALQAEVTALRECIRGLTNMPRLDQHAAVVEGVGFLHPPSSYSSAVGASLPVHGGAIALPEQTDYGDDY